MQISKLSVTVCATALCWSVAWVQAADETPAQAAAIAALRQKAAAEDSATSQAPTASAVTPTAQPEVTPAQAAAIAALRQKAQATDNPGGTPTTPGATPVMVDSSGVVSPRDAAADAAQAQVVAEAQDAARQRATAIKVEEQRKAEIAIMNAKIAAEEAAKAQAAADQKAADEAAQAKAAADAAAAKVAAEQAAAQKQAEAQAAAQKLADEQAAKKAADAQAAAQKAADEQAAAKAKAAADAAAEAYYPGKELGFQRIQTPPSPITPEKQALLDALLAKYQADQISPEEYHKQRAAIIAQP